MDKENIVNIIFIWLVVICLSSIIACSIGAKENASGKGLNEILTTDAWRYLGNKDYDGAINKAKECISNFGESAEKIQYHLLSAKEILPPTGSVNEETKKTIFNRGLLNDVATCYFIMGKAYQGLKNEESAINAFKKAETFTYARTWDPKGWFWSPSEAASKELKQLEK